MSAPSDYAFVILADLIRLWYIQRNSNCNRPSLLTNPHINIRNAICRNVFHVCHQILLSVLSWQTLNDLNDTLITFDSPHDNHLISNVVFSLKGLLSISRGYQLLGSAMASTSRIVWIEFISQQFVPSFRWNTPSTCAQYLPQTSWTFSMSVGCLHLLVYRSASMVCQSHGRNGTTWPSKQEHFSKWLIPLKKVSDRSDQGSWGHLWISSTCERRFYTSFRLAWVSFFRIFFLRHPTSQTVSKETHRKRINPTAGLLIPQAEYLSYWFEINWRKIRPISMNSKSLSSGQRFWSQEHVIMKIIGFCGKLKMLHSYGNG